MIDLPRRNVQVAVAPTPADTGSVRSVARALDIITSFSARHPRLHLRDLAEITEIPKPSTHRIATTLLTRGFLAQDDDGAYSLGRSLLELGGLVQARSVVHRSAQRLIERLADQTEETIVLVEVSWADRTTLVTHKWSGQRALAIDAQIGRRAHLANGCVSKALLAALEPSVVDLILPQLWLAPRTARSFADQTAFRHEIASVAQRGFAIETEEKVVGVTGVAVAMTDESMPFGAIAVLAPVSRTSARELERLGGLMKGEIAKIKSETSDPSAQRLTPRSGALAPSKPTFVDPSNPRATDRRRVRAVERAMDLFDALGQDHHCLSLNDLSAAVSLPSATTHRIAQTLVARDFLHQDTRRRYWLGGRLLETGAMVSNSSALAQLSNDAIDRIAHQTDETILVAETDWETLTLTIVGKRPAAHPLAITAPVGDVTLIGNGCIGKSVVAALDGVEAARTISRLTLSKRTSKSATNKSEYRVLIDRARNDGFAIDEQEYFDDVTGASVAVMMGERVVGAISIVGPAERIDVAEMYRLGELIRTALGDLAPAASMSSLPGD